MYFTDPNKTMSVSTDATATTTEPSYTASWIDTDTSVIGRRRFGDSVGALNGTTAVTVVPPLGVGSAAREIAVVSINNRDTVSHVITVNKVENGTSYVIRKATLAANETLSYDGKVWAVYTAAGEAKSSLLGANTDAPGTKNGATIAVSEQGSGVLHKTVLTCTATPISVADDAGVAQYGGVLVYTFPAGLITTFGAVINGSLTLGTTGTIIAAYTGVNALGTVVATTGATLIAGEATWLQSTANATAVNKVAAVSSVSIATQLTESGERVFDGRSVPAPVYLNFAIADDATHTAGTGSFTGTITLMWANIGS